MIKKILLCALMVTTISFTAQAQQVIEDFETWSTYTVSNSAQTTTVQLTEPNAWSCSDSFVVGFGLFLNPSGTYQAQIFQENPGFAGTGALRAVSKNQDAILAVGMPAKAYPAIATNSLIAVDVVNSTFNQMGGTPVTYNPLSTSMQVKANLVGGDTAYITAEVIDNSDGGDSIMAVADTILTSNLTAYTQINLPFQYLPTTGLSATIVRYTISSGNPLALLDSTNTFSVNDSSEIVVDNIEIGAPNGITQRINSKPIAKVYPTYQVNNLHIDLIDVNKSVVFELYNSLGQLVKKEELVKVNNTISMSDIVPANYVYILKKENVIYQTGKLVR